MDNYSAWKCIGNSMSLFPCKEKFMVFDQSVDCAFKSERFEIPHPGVEVPFSNRANSEEMHEDSDEIDALLYSDSEEEEEEATSAGHSPAEQSMEEVASSLAVEEVASSLAVPGKRKRTDESNISMVDTASSAGAYYQSMVQGYGEEDAESSCEGGEEHCEDEASERKRVKRERILETVALLRQIIPGGHGKDAAAVIDDAIRYLKSLKLQAMALEATSIL